MLLSLGCCCHKATSYCRNLWTYIQLASYSTGSCIGTRPAQRCICCSSYDKWWLHGWCIGYARYHLHLPAEWTIWNWNQIPCPSLRWNLKMTVSNRNLLFQGLFSGAMSAMLVSGKAILKNKNDNLPYLFKCCDVWGCLHWLSACSEHLTLEGVGWYRASCIYFCWYEYQLHPKISKPSLPLSKPLQLRRGEFMMFFSTNFGASILSISMQPPKNTQMTNGFFRAQKVIPFYSDPPAV